jgi:hypothetical protein
LHTSTVGLSIVIKIDSVILVIQNVVLSTVMIKFIALRSLAIAMRSIFFTAFVKGGKARGIPPSPLPPLFDPYILGIYL